MTDPIFKAKKITPIALLGPFTRLGNMGATAKKDHIEMLVSIDDFTARVGLINSYIELEWLGFKLNNYCASFKPANLSALLEFCRINSEYHVVTYVSPGRYVNKYVSGARTYCLANGDKNPALVLNHLIDPQRHLKEEDVISSALAMLRDIKGSGKG